MTRYTAYQLACGAVQIFEGQCAGSFKVELYMEHGVYHVRSFHEVLDPLGPSTIKRHWSSFHTVKEAQKLFSELKRWFKTKEKLVAWIAETGGAS